MRALITLLAACVFAASAEAAPGLSGSWHWWLETLPAVAATRRVIAVDLPGCGSSDMPAQPLTLDLWCDQLDALCEHLGLDRVSVAGFSLGTVVAPHMAVRHPARVERLVLVGGAAAVHRSRPTRPRRHRTPPTEDGRRRARRVAVRTGPAPGGGEAPRRPPPTAAKARARRLRAPPGAPARRPRRAPALRDRRPGVVASARACIGQPAYDRLEQITCPVLAINGKHDALAPADDIAELARRLPHARTRVFHDAAHWPQLECPADFNAELIGWLDQDPCQGGRWSSATRPVPASGPRRG